MSVTAFSVKQHHPFKSAHIFRANPCISVIFCGDLMVPRWRRGTTVTAFKRGNEKEEKQTQSLPNQLQTSARGEARAAAEAAENRDKIICVSRLYSRGFVFLMRKDQSGSPGSGSSMERHAKCTCVCSCSSDVLHRLSQTSPRLLLLRATFTGSAALFFHTPASFTEQLWRL